MDCKDCIHYCVCKDLAETLEMEGCICNNFYHFKDKSRFIELPCKIVDTVYLVRDKCTCNKAVCLEKGGIGITRCEIEPCDAYIQEVPFSLYLFNTLGKTVFLTKEEAEAKLKELNENE